MPGSIKGLLELKASIERWRGLAARRAMPSASALATLIQAQATALDLATAEPAWDRDAEGQSCELSARPCSSSNTR